MAATEPIAADVSYARAYDAAEFLDWSVGDLLRDAARQVPDRLALIVPAAEGREERRWTYRELEAQSRRAAQALRRYFRPGDHVATWAGASPEILFLQMGAALAGIVLVTLNPANRAAELKYLLAQSRARGLFLDRSFRKMDNVAIIDGLAPELPTLERIFYMDEWDAFATADADAALESAGPETPALILFTSGTTGKPKGVVLRHRSIVNNARLSTARIAPSPGSAWLNVLPMFHVGGSVTMTLGCLSNLGTQVMLPEFSADAMLDALRRYDVAITMAVPTMLHAMFQSAHFPPGGFPALEVIVTGATAIAPELVREVGKRFGVEVMVMFGQTEAGGCMCLTRRGDDEERVTRSVGAPLPLSEAKVISTSDGRLVPRGEIGEICVRTRCAMLEYFQMPDKTAETLDADGWVHTGDLGVMRPDGYLQVTGRLKDMIIRGGENIYPREIEDVLAEHPAVAQSAVFGVPDEKWGEQVAAAVILKPGQSESAEALSEFLQARISRHKVPKLWRFVSAFPVNASGKIQKFVLQEQYSRAEMA